MKRTRRITVQLTTYEYERIRAAADLDSRSIADFMRLGAKSRVVSIEKFHNVVPRDQVEQ